jgi:hypothetical protein
VPGFIWLLFSRCHPLSRIVTLCHSLSWMVTLGLLSHICHFCWCHHTWSRSLTVGHAWSRTVTLLPHSLLFVKLAQCQVIFGCSFHVLTHFHTLSWMVTLGLFSHVCHSCWCFIAHGLAFLRLVTLGHALPRFATILFYLLSYLCARWYVCSFFALSKEIILFLETENLDKSSRGSYMTWDSCVPSPFLPI